jgi:hypothetical protein
MAGENKRRERGHKRWQGKLESKRVAKTHCLRKVSVVRWLNRIAS